MEGPCLNEKVPSECLWNAQLCSQLHQQNHGALLVSSGGTAGCGEERGLDIESEDLVVSLYPARVLPLSEPIFS